MSERGKYIYCIVGNRQEQVFDGVVPIGGGTGTVHTLVCEGLSAVASDCVVQQHDNSRANMLAHERVLERVMRECPILPVRFGTVAGTSSPEDAVRRLLNRRHQEFLNLLTDMTGKVELGLKASWKDERAVFQELLSEREAIKRLRDSLAGKPPVATHYERLRLGEMLKGALDRKRAREAEQILGKLRMAAASVVENSPLTERMIVNAAFLVDRKSEDKFDQAVNALDADIGARVLLKYVGPVPPYNFVNITVNWQES